MPTVDIITDVILVAYIHVILTAYIYVILTAHIYVILVSYTSKEVLHHAIVSQTHIPNIMRKHRKTSHLMEILHNYHDVSKHSKVLKTRENEIP